MQAIGSVRPGREGAPVWSRLSALPGVGGLLITCSSTVPLAAKVCGADGPVKTREHRSLSQELLVAPSPRLLTPVLRDMTSFIGAHASGDELPETWA